METSDPFGDINEKHIITLMYVANFWRLLPQLLMKMSEHCQSERLDRVTHELHCQFLEMADSVFRTSDKPMTVSEYYRILFAMRDHTQPLVVELEQVADEMGMDLMVPIANNGEIIAIKLSEWIPNRLINR